MQPATAAAPLGVYIHVRVCRLHCPYCDFYTYPAGRGRQAEFVDAVIREVAMIPRRLDPADYRVESIYFGGGTPSLLAPEQLGRTVAALHDVLPRAARLEVTLEANPEDVTAARLNGLRQNGINRLSLGVQSFSPTVLKNLGRPGDTDSVHSALAQVGGWADWSADLIFGWHGQTASQWAEELTLLLQYEPPHVSLYQLTLEPRTRFGVLAGQGRMQVAASDLQADLYLQAIEHLEAAGLHLYEVSSFARAGHRSRHNSAYWSRQAYVGLGPAAASFLWGRRTENVRSLPQYIRRLRNFWSAVSAIEVLTPWEEWCERIWLGLRTVEGIPVRLPGPKAAPLLDRARADDLIVDRPPGHIALTRKGMAVADGFVRRILLTADSVNLPGLSRNRHI